MLSLCPASPSLHLRFCGVLFYGNLVGEPGSLGDLGVSFQLYPEGLPDLITNLSVLICLTRGLGQVTMISRKTSV